MCEWEGSYHIISYHINRSLLKNTRRNLLKCEMKKKEPHLDMKERGIVWLIGYVDVGKWERAWKVVGSSEHIHIMKQKRIRDRERGKNSREGNRNLIEGSQSAMDGEGKKSRRSKVHSSMPWKVWILVKLRSYL